MMKGGRSQLRLGMALLPSLLILAIFYFYPMWTILIESVMDPHFGWQNFSWFFRNSVNTAVLIRTLWISLLVTVICVGVAFPFARYLTLVGPTARSWLLIVILIPFWTSTVVRTFAWVILLQDSGPIGQVAGWFGVKSLGLIRTPTAVLIGMAQVLLPFVILPIYATVSQIDSRLMLAARSLGARPFRAFVTVYLPLAAPGISAGALLCFVMAIGFYITPAMLGSSREAFLSTLIQGQVQGLAQWGHGAVVGLMLLLVTLVILGCAAYLGKRSGILTESTIGGSKA